jgi:predicted nucleic acid-binding protein
VDVELLEDAARLAAKYGLSAVDAIHAAAALMSKATGIITTERATKPLHRLTEVRVTTIHRDSE